MVRGLVLKNSPDPSTSNETPQLAGFEEPRAETACVRRPLGCSPSLSKEKPKPKGTKCARTRALCLRAHRSRPRRRATCVGRFPKVDGSRGIGCESYVARWRRPEN
jgi:hypothetical protein